MDPALRDRDRDRGRRHQTVTACDPAAEAAITATHLNVNQQALDEGWTAWADASHPHDLLWGTLVALPGPPPP